MRSHLLLLLLLVSACSASPPRLGDLSNWEPHRIGLGRKVLEIKIPPGMNREFLDERVPPFVDLSQPGLFDGAGQGPQLLARHWEYRAGMTTIPDGMLTATIFVHRSAIPLSGLESLKKCVAESLKLEAADRYAKSGIAGATNDIVSADVVKIAGKEGLRVQYSASPSDYVVPLDASHYLAISVRYAGFTKAEWERDAKAAAFAILSAMHIEDADMLDH